MQNMYGHIRNTCYNVLPFCTIYGMRGRITTMLWLQQKDFWIKKDFIFVDWRGLVSKLTTCRYFIIQNSVKLSEVHCLSEINTCHKTQVNYLLVGEIVISLKRIKINEIVKEASFTKFVEISEKYQNMIQLTLNEKITFVDVKMKNSESFWSDFERERETAWPDVGIKRAQFFQ